MEQVRWGIMGPGKIAYRWINGARQVQEMDITAIAGRNRDNVDTFSTQHGIKNKYYSYQAMAQSDEVDCVYVATPHSTHKELAMLAMQNGKHVLVEKPITTSEKDLADMIACAKENGVFLMEAMWTRFFPAMADLRQLLDSGKVGTVRSVHAAFSYRAEVDKASRLFDPNQAGGGLMDVGVYPLHFADIVYDQAPLSIVGYAAIGTDEHSIEVDEQATLLAAYPGGATAVLSCGVRTQMPEVVTIYTTEAMITFPTFWKPTVMEIQYYGGETETRTYEVALTKPDYVDEGFQYEIRHVCGCIQQGLTQSPVMTHEKSRAILRQCDALRRQWGLVFPFEK